MPALTSPQLTSLRANGHKAKFYLSISKPATLLTALIDGSPARGATSISYDTGGGTGFSRIKAGQTLLVVTATGTKNVRIRGISGNQTSGTITVAANGIVWADNQALTVLEDYEPRSWLPRFNEANQFRKDWDIAYPGLYPATLPVCIAGPNRASKITSGSITGQITVGADNGLIDSELPPAGYFPGVDPVFFGHDMDDANAWFRFQNVAIPNGATIISAALSFVSSGNQSASVALNIYGEAADNPAAPTSLADYNARSVTAAVAWNFSTAWTDGVAYSTPSLVPIVQTTVNRPGWASGNAMQFFVKNNGGVNIRNVENMSAVLTVTYTIPVVFDLDESASYAIAQGASIASYAASIVPATGATIDFNTSTGIGTVTITQAGQYWLEASCTDTNSQSQTTRRRLITHSDDPASDDYPYTDFKITALSGDWERGGWVLNIEVNGTADASQFPENGLVMLWVETWYGSTKQYVGGISGAPQMLFVGYIRQGTVTANWDRGSVSFEAATVEAILREHYMRNLPLQATASPGDWYEYANWLTPGRAAHYLWRWHSNLLEIADVYGLTANSLRRKYCDFPKGNLYSQADTLLRQQSIVAHVVSNKAGQIYVVQDIQYLDDTARAARPVVAEITKADRHGDITIVERDATVAFVRVEGLYFDGAAATPYCAIAPGLAPEERGPNEMAITQQVVSGQDHTNSLAGRYLAVANNKEPEARIKFSGNYAGVLDIAGPFDGTAGGQEWWQMDMAAGDTTRGIVWTDKKMVLRTINNQIDPANGMILSETVFEPEAEGPPGVADDYCQSSTPIPERPDAPDWSDGIGALVSFSSLYYRDDNDSDWSEHSTEFAFNHGCVDPYWESRQGTSNPEAAILWGAGNGVIKRSLDAGRTWSDKTPVTDPPNTWSDGIAPSVANLSFTQILPDPWAVGRFIALATWQNGSDLWRGWLLVTPDDGASWSWYAPYTGTLPDQLKPIWAAINGASLLTTTWEDRATDKIMLHRRGATSLNFVAEYDLGATTLAELEVRTYYAFPVCVLDDDALWHVAGRMNAPAGLGGVRHIIRTANTGAAWSGFEGSWSTDYCATLYIGLDNDGDREFYAVRQNG